MYNKKRKSIDNSEVIDMRKNKSLYDYVEEASIKYILDTWPAKIPRNSPCPCNSGKKYKNCHKNDIDKWREYYEENTNE